jgi:hypothetical protein
MNQNVIYLAKKGAIRCAANRWPQKAARRSGRERHGRSQVRQMDEVSSPAPALRQPGAGPDQVRRKPCTMGCHRAGLAVVREHPKEGAERATAGVL